MKHLKMLGLAAVAVTALTALAGTSSASATVLCKTNTNPCTEDYAAGTKVTMKLPSGFDMKWTGVGDTCLFSSLAGETSNTGGSGSTVSVKLSEVSWTSCTLTWEPLKIGTLEIKYANGGLQNDLTLKGTEWRVSGCTYSAGSGTKIGVITPSIEGSVAKVSIQATFARVSGGFCSSTVTWEGNYEVTAPNPLYVAES
jgi:hypothetical protein